MTDTATLPPPAATPDRSNYWADAKCAKAFWGQQELPAFQQLVADTIQTADPRPGQHWLDLGCGGGTLTRGLWNASGGQVGSILGVDCAEANAGRYEKLRAELSPSPGARVAFECHDFSAGLTPWADGSFDAAVSGLSISYAEHFDVYTGTWTQAGYDRLLGEVFRVLKPGGRFVFSVNVPEPSWWAVGGQSLSGVLRSRRPVRLLKNALRMMRYGTWLKREARRGRFHYLPAAAVTAKLTHAGFTPVSHAVSYARQAYLFCATRP